MRRHAASLAALFAALASPVTLQAQEPLAPEARESLQCAIWASYFSVEFQDQPEGAAFTYALNYFVGHYEGLTGAGINQALDEELVTATMEGLDALTPACTARMEGYGTRMVEWGEAFQAIGESLPADEPTT